MRVENANGRDRGFTMVELLMVIGIIAMLAVLSIPMLLPALRHNQLTAAADELRVRFSATRELAVSHNTFTRMIFNAQQGTYRVLEYDPTESEWGQVGPVYSLGDSVQFAQGGVNFAGNQATFDPYGSLTAGGSITLQHTRSGNQLQLVAIIAVGKLQEEEA